jgi:adenylate cyclase
MAPAEKWRKIRISLLISFLSLAALLFASRAKIQDYLELKTLDLRSQFRERASVENKDIALILVDEASLRSLKPIVGRWPWPRAVFAEMIDFLSDCGAKAVLFDILFSEPEKNSSDDAALAQSTRRNGKTIHAFQILLDEEDELNKSLLNPPIPKAIREKFALKNITDPQKIFEKPANNVYLPLDELAEASSELGVVNYLPDADGIFRRTELVRYYQGNYYATLGLAGVLSTLSRPELRVEKNRLWLGDLAIPLDDGRYMISPTQKFPAFSASGVLATMRKVNRGDFRNLFVSPNDFKNKIVLIGASAAGTYDLIHSPLGARVPGVYSHASVIQNILSHSFPRKISAKYYYWLIFALVFVLSYLILENSSLFVQIVVPAAALVVYSGLAFWLYQKHLLILDMVFPSTWIAAATGGSVAYSAFTEGRERRRARKMLAQYVSPSVLAEVMDKRREFLDAEIGIMQNLTVFFSDIRNFTRISENTDPKQIVEMLNHYFRDMIDIVFKYDGTLDKFIGDAVMAFWGAPLKIADHPLKSVCAALEMREKLDGINAFFRAKDYAEFHIGMGIHSGPVILGNIGSQKKLNYTVIGDNVNLASRLEGLTKMYGCDIIISETTYEAVKTEIACRVVDVVRVKGKNQAIRIYHPLAHIRQKDFDNAAARTKLWEEAFSLYQNRRWEDALKLYASFSQTQADDLLPALFANRCKTFQTSPPPENWDGATTLSTK